MRRRPGRSTGTGTGTKTGAIHRTAVVEGEVLLGEGCVVGPLAVLRGPLALGRGTVVDALAVVDGPAVLGASNRVHPHAALGGPPQDRTYRGEATELRAGDGNVFREHVTVHRGTAKGGGLTRLGDRNLLMAGCHVAHDCRIGNDVQMANGAALAGHVDVGDHAVLGGLVAVAPFVRLGESALVAGGAMVDRDVPPFCVAAGDRAAIVAPNVVGLRRRGATREAIAALRAAFRLLFRESRAWRAALRACAPLGRDEPLVRALLDFLEASRLGVRRGG